MKRPILLISFFLIYSVVIGQNRIYNQQEIDSFVNNELTFENVDEFKKMLTSSKKLNGWSKYFSVLCSNFTVKAENDSAYFYGFKAIEYYKNVRIKSSIDEESLLLVYFNLGLIDYREGNYKSSIEYLQKSLDLEKKYPYKYKSYIRGYLAGNHLKMGNNRLALKYYHKNLKDSIYTAIPQPHVVTLTRVGILYTNLYLNKRDSALFYFKKAIQASYETKYKANLPIIYGNIGDLFQETEPDSTLYYYRQSKKAFKNYQFEKNISPNNLDYFQIVNDNYINIYDGKISTAIHNLTIVVDSLFTQVNNKGDRGILIKAFDYLILAYEKSGDFKNANTVLKERNRFQNIFHKEEIDQKLTKLELDYETKKKEEEIKGLKAKAESKNTIAKQQQILLLSGIGVLLLLLILGSLSYRQNTLKNKYEKVSLQQRLLRSQMNPHFLFNALNKAQLLVKKNAGDAEKYIINLAKLLRLTLENSREDFVPLSDELTALENYLNLQSDFSKKFDYNIDLGGNVEAEWCQIPPMLIQPIVENAIIHGISNLDYKGHIHIQLIKESEKTLMCLVTDNGKGFSKDTIKINQSTSHKSVSMAIVEERLSVYHKKTKNTTWLSIDSKNRTGTEEKGTSVYFSIPFSSL